MVGEGKQYEDLVGEIISPKCQANRYGKQPQSRIGATPWGTTHNIDWEIWSLDNPNLRALLSCKYQDSGGTAEEKIPYEVIKLARSTLTRDSESLGWLSEVMGGQKDYASFSFHGSRKTFQQWWAEYNFLQQTS